MPEDRLALRSLHFPEAGGECWRVHQLLSDTYDRMLAQKRSCEMVVAVSRPLTREQADLFNDQNIALQTAAATVVGALFPATRGRYKAAAGGAAGFAVGLVLEPRHAGDVVVAVEAWVAGGIGPQHTSSAVLIKNKGGVR